MLHEVSLYCTTPDRHTLVSVSIPLWYEVERLPNGKHKTIGALPFCNNERHLLLTTIHSNDN